MPPVEPRAVTRGALVAGVVCLPLALISTVVIEENQPSNWAVPLFLGVLLGLVAGGWVASRAATDSPLVSGALAGLAGFVIVQSIGVVIRLAEGDDVGWTKIAGTAVLAYGCGLTGAVLAERLRSRQAPGGSKPL
jgi:putative membrane protein (TIGR04086 family)